MGCWRFSLFHLVLHLLYQYIICFDTLLGSEEIFDTLQGSEVFDKLMGFDQFLMFWRPLVFLIIWYHQSFDKKKKSNFFYTLKRLCFWRIDSLTPLENFWRFAGAPGAVSVTQPHGPTAPLRKVNKARLGLAALTGLTHDRTTDPI